MTRQELQTKGTQVILDNNKCILALSPRSGKTKLTLDALTKIPGDILISVPSEFMIDVWKSECQKWAFKNPLRLYFTCHASLHKQSKFKTLVLDECHSCTSEIRIEGIKQIKANRIIGLSGSLGIKAREILKERLGLEVLLEHSVDNAVQNNIISDYEIYIHQIPLLPEEQKEYNKLTGIVNWAKDKGGKTLMFASLKRSRFLFNLKSKNDYSKKLINNFDRCITFCQLISVANNICNISYHGKSKENTLQLFQEEKINQLGLVKLANEGQTFVNLDTVVVVGVNSSEVSMIQRILRCMNLDKESKIANIHIIVSKNTVESDKWLLTALQSFDKQKIKIIN